MNSFDIEDLRGITYQQSMSVGAQIELEAMKSENALREVNNEAPAYRYDDFIELINKYQLGHNSIANNMHWGNR